MAETVALWGTVGVLIGALIATYQLIQIRRYLGPILFRSDIGIIIAEHILAGSLWLVVLMIWGLSRQLGLLHGTIAEWGAVVVVALILLIVWGFVLRAHLWYSSTNGDG